MVSESRPKPRARLHEGPALAISIALAIAVVALVCVWWTGGSESGVRAAIRFTARTSFALFALAYSASALDQLIPYAFTRWQRSNRRYLGLAFAASHIVHAGAIGALAVWHAPALREHVRHTNVIPGLIGYLFIAAMAATSFDCSARAIGPRAWRWLHALGGFYLWLSFLKSFGSRIAVSPVYGLPVLALMAIMALRLVAKLSKSSPRRV